MVCRAVSLADGTDRAAAQASAAPFGCSTILIAPSSLRTRYGLPPGRGLNAVGVVLLDDVEPLPPIDDALDRRQGVAGRDHEVAGGSDLVVFLGRQLEDLQAVRIAAFADHRPTASIEQT